MDMPEILDKYVLPTIVASMVGVMGYVMGSQKVTEKAVTRLYHPFEAEYFNIIKNDINCSHRLDKPCQTLQELQIKAAEFQRLQASLSAPDPDKETKTLDRLTRLQNSR